TRTQPASGAAAYLTATSKPPPRERRTWIGTRANLTPQSGSSQWRKPMHQREMVGDFDTRQNRSGMPSDNVSCPPTPAQCQSAGKWRDFEVVPATIPMFAEA